MALSPLIKETLFYSRKRPLQKATISKNTENNWPWATQPHWVHLQIYSTAPEPKAQETPQKMDQKDFKGHGRNSAVRLCLLEMTGKPHQWDLNNLAI